MDVSGGRGLRTLRVFVRKAWPVGSPLAGMKELEGQVRSSAEPLKWEWHVPTGAE